MPIEPTTATPPRGKPVIWDPPPETADTSALLGAAPANNSTPQVAHALDGSDIVRSTPTEPQDHRPILFYNEQCGFCRRVAAWIIKNDDPKHDGYQLLDERPIGVDPVALAKVAPRAKMTELYETLHLQMPDGSFKKGGLALTEIMRRLPDTEWAAALVDTLRIGSFKPLQLGVDAVYFLADKLRPAFGCNSCGTPVPWWGHPLVWIIKGGSWVGGAIAKLF